jgi:hypothetical protein
MRRDAPRVYAVIVLEKPIFILQGVYGVVPYTAARIRKKPSEFLYRLRRYICFNALFHLEVVKLVLRKDAMLPVLQLASIVSS